MPLQTLRSLVIVLAAIVMTVSLFPQPALADDATRISRLESEIQQLRIRMDDQLRRINRLEAELDRRSSVPPIGTLPRRYQPQAESVATDQFPWHLPATWAGITVGMSEVQVRQMLGEPTSVESADILKTLFYRGTVAGRGTISGHVNLRDGRVVAVKRPEF